MKPKDQIAAAAASAFFPDPIIKAATRQRLVSLARSHFGGGFVDQASRLIERSGYIRMPDQRGTLRDLSGEQRLRLFVDTVTTFQSNLDYWLQGMDNDVLDVFPAQALICVVPEAREVMDWKRFWPACGGHFFGDRMVALKWDPVWSKISAFDLPFPPYQLGSGYEVEDVDRQEAESLGFKVPFKFTATVKIDLDGEDLKRRFASGLEVLMVEHAAPPHI